MPVFADKPTGSDNDKTVLTVGRTDRMRVIVGVPDPDVAFTHAGATAEGLVDSLPHHTFPRQGRAHLAGRQP
jgi:hypothetical protein